MYDFIVDLIGELPTEFTFIYGIATLVLTLLVLSFLFTLFYVPVLLIRR